MTKIAFDGKDMIDKKITHRYIKEKLDLPSYYGENLDGLWDMLSSCDKKIKINFINLDDLFENLGLYGDSIIEVFKDAEKENHNISIEF